MSNTTFLDICKTVRQECGISGDGNPTTVVGQTGILGKIVDRTAREWVRIQRSRPYWKFLHSQFNFNTVAGTIDYTVHQAPISKTDVDKFDMDNVYMYLTATGTDDEKALKWRDYRWFRQNYRTFPSGRPSVITEKPGRILSFERNPDDIYTVTIDYWKTPELLAADTDVPACPEQHRETIVWASVMAYAGPTGAGNLYQYAMERYKKAYFDLVVDQGDLPQHVDSFPIARGIGRPEIITIPGVK